MILPSSMTGFPSKLPHGSGRMMALDRRRLLLAFKKPQERHDIEAFLYRSNAGLVLEDFNKPTQEKLANQRERINHTKEHYWVRTKNGKPLTPQLFKVLKTKEWRSRLAWIGPVYHLAKTKGLRGSLCPMPNALLIKPLGDQKAVNADHFNALIRKHAPLQLFKNVSADDKYAWGYWYVQLKERSKKTIYEARQALLPSSKGKAHERKTLVDYAGFDIAPMIRSTGSFTPHDPLFVAARQWNLQRIGAQFGWDYTKGKGVMVCVLDTGFDLTHPDLIDRFKDSGGGIDLDDRNLRAAGDQADPHGTACAGILGASIDNQDSQGNYVGIAGLAGECQIWPIAYATRNLGESSVVHDAINYLTTEIVDPQQVDVISYSHNFQLLEDRVLNEAIDHTWSQGILMCVSSGNDGQGLVYPAKHPKVMACGSIGRDDKRVSSSNFGDDIAGGYLSVVAPGVNIPTTWRQGKGTLLQGNYDLFDGTSAATPHVAGLAALLISAFPRLNRKPDEVRRIIEESAEELPGYVYKDFSKRTNKGWNNKTGFGLINVQNAFNQAIGEFGAPP